MKRPPGPGQAFHARRGYVHLAVQLAFLALCIRLAVIQSLHHERYAALAARMERDTVVRAPQRGHIMDRNGHQLAVAAKALSVWANPRVMPAAARESIAAALGEALQLDSNHVAARLAKD